MTYLEMLDAIIKTYVMDKSNGFNFAEVKFDDILPVLRGLREYVYALELRIDASEKLLDKLAEKGEMAEWMTGQN